MHVEYGNDNYYARFHNPRCHRYIESHFSLLLDVKLRQRQCSIVPACKVCIGQLLCKGFMILCFKGTEKDTSVFHSM